MLDIFLSPITWVILFSLFAIPVAMRGRFVKLRMWSPVIAASLLYVCSTETVANSLWEGLELGAPSTYKEDTTYEAVVLLGGVVNERAMMTKPGPSYNDNVERLLATYDLLRRGKAKVAIISGGVPDSARNDQNEARVLAKQLVAWGIAEDRVIIEPKARNTWENALNAKTILDERNLTRVVIVTSAFHMRRAYGCFKKAGLPNVATLPVDYRSFDSGRFGTSMMPRAGALETTTAAIREFFGRAVYWVKGYSS